ncbi:MAG: hypothetical protein C0501_24505, partial [Isosphaera sp.]|nr:hypothetical protein [Isosphaera sp.]
AASAAHADPGGRKVLVVLVGQVGWHVAGRLVAPRSVALHLLPPCTPESPPVEPLRPLAREAVANRSGGRPDRLRATPRARLAYPATDPAGGRPVVGFHRARRSERYRSSESVGAG